MGCRGPLPGTQGSADATAVGPASDRPKAISAAPAVVRSFLLVCMAPQFVGWLDVLTIAGDPCGLLAVCLRFSCEPLHPQPGPGSTRRVGGTHPHRRATIPSRDSIKPAYRLIVGAVVTGGVVGDAVTGGVMGVGDGGVVPWPPGPPAHDTAATNTTANHDARIVTRRSSRLKPVAIVSPRRISRIMPSN